MGLYIDVRKQEYLINRRNFLMKKNVKTRDYEYYTPYECCVRSGGSGITRGGQDITRGGYGVMNSYVEEDTLTVWKVFKRIIAFMCGIITFASVLLMLAGLWLVGDAIHVSNWGGEINILNYQISLNAAYGLSAICYFGGALLAYLFYHITERIWD